MISALAAIPRSGASTVSPALREAASRRALVARPRLSSGHGTRFQHSDAGSSSSGSSASSSHIAAGVAGGVTVLLGGYIAYQFSDLKKYARVAKSTKNYLQETRNELAQSLSAQFNSNDSTVSTIAQQPNAALSYLRKVTQSYVAVIPGLGSYVDSTFDSFDKIVERHGDEAKKITQGAYEEIQKIVEEAKSRSGSGGEDLKDVSLDDAFKVLEVLRRRTEELYELGKKAGKDAVGEVLEKNPEVKEKLGGGYEQLKSMVDSRGPEAKKALDEVTDRIKSVVQQGPNSDNLSELANLIREKTDQVRSIAEPAAQEAWDKSIKSAQPYLDKLPDLRQFLDQKKSAFLAAGASALTSGKTLNLNELTDKLKDIVDIKDEGKKKEKVQQLKEYLSQKADEAQKSLGGGSLTGKLNWETLASYVKTIPGGDQMLDKAPNAKALLELSMDKGEDAAKLTKETWEEVLRVLEDKGQKARKLAEETKEEGKKRT